MEKSINYCQTSFTEEISLELYKRLQYLGIIPNEIRKNHIGRSDYSKHLIQPWSVWLDYNLNSWDADIVKRVLRTKDEPNMTRTNARIMDYEKIIHICQERIRQLRFEKDNTIPFIPKEKITTTSNSEDPTLWVTDTTASTLEVESDKCI